MFPRIFANLPEGIRLADRAAVYENSGREHVRIATVHAGTYGATTRTQHGGRA